MKQKFLHAMFVCSLLCVGIQVAHAGVIRSFNSNIRLQKDSALDVTETIVMDFGDAERHGIYRDVPMRLKRHNKTYNIYIKILSITDENGNELTYKTSSKGRSLDIRIGDADILITGVHTYKLHYMVSHAVIFFNGKPEVYWNVTGDYWPFAMQQVKARFYPPSDVDINQLETKSFIGHPGASHPAPSENEAKEVTFYTSNLDAGGGLTFVVGLPKDSVVPLYADLAITTDDATYDPTTQKLDLTIHNVGAKESGAFTIRILDGTKVLLEKQMSSLKASTDPIHQSIDLSLQVNPSAKIQVQLDPTDTVPEITKENNQISFTPSTLSAPDQTSAKEMPH